MVSLENYYRPFYYLGLNFAVLVPSIESLDGSYPRKKEWSHLLGDIVQYIERVGKTHDKDYTMLPNAQSVHRRSNCEWVQTCVEMGNSLKR